MRRIFLFLALIVVAALAIYWFTDSPDVENRPDANSSARDSSLGSWRLTGVVRDLERRPLTEARVQVWVSRGNMIIEKLDNRTQRDGSYAFHLNAVTEASFSERSTMEIRVRADSPGYDFDEHFLDFRRHKNTATSLDPALSPAAVLRGSVQSHDGIAVSCVDVHAVGPQMKAEGRTDANGRYVLYVYEEGSFQVGLACDFNTSVTPVRVSLGDDVVVPMKVLPEWASISGTAVLLNGVAASNLTIDCASGWKEMPPHEYVEATSCTTDARGRFVLHTRITDPVELSIAENLDPSMSADAKGGDTDVRLIRGEVALLIRIVGEDGSEFSGASLSVTGGEPRTDEQARRVIAGELEEDALHNYTGMGESFSAPTTEFFGKPGTVWKIAAHAGDLRASKTITLESPRTEVILRLAE